MRYVLLGAFLCATIVLPAASLDYLASGQVELVSDADGENLRGGDCDGNTMYFGKVYCHEGARICYGFNFECEERSVSSYLCENGDGDEVETEIELHDGCSVCGGYCGAQFMTIPGKKKCS